MSGPSTRRERLATLTKRADHLESRIARAAETGSEQRGLSYDRAELAALRWAIRELTGQLTGEASRT